MTSAPVLLWRRLLAEFPGSGFLAAGGDRFRDRRAAAVPGETGLQLLENAAATAAGLFAIILMFGPVSGGHFNPVVSFSFANPAITIGRMFSNTFAGIIVPHSAGRAPSRAAHDGALPSADRPSGPVQPH